MSEARGCFAIRSPASILKAEAGEAAGFSSLFGLLVWWPRGLWHRAPGSPAACPRQSPEGLAARVRLGASGRERSSARNWPGSGGAVCGGRGAGLGILTRPSRALLAAPPTPRRGRCPALTPSPADRPPQLAGVSRGGAVVRSRPAPTPPGEGGARPAGVHSPPPPPS